MVNVAYCTVESFKDQRGVIQQKVLIVCILRITWCHCPPDPWHLNSDRDASSCDSLLAVKIPLFAVNAEDDPVSFFRLEWCVVQLILHRSQLKKASPLRSLSKTRIQSSVLLHVEGI